MKFEDTNAQHQRALAKFVQREVIYCVSELVDHLAELEPDTIAEFGIHFRTDWLEPATDHVRSMPADEVIEELESIGIEPNEDPIDVLRTALIANLEDETIDAQAFCDAHSIEPYEHEALEHWIVTPWLAERLIELGDEMACKDFYGLCVWGRTCSGQSVSMDAAIFRIASELPDSHWIVREAMRTD